MKTILFLSTLLLHGFLIYAGCPRGIQDSVVEVNQNGDAGTTASSTSVESILPVTLTDFQGGLKSNQVTLNWKTMMESGIDHYEVLRSTDDLNFDQIGVLASKSTINNTDYQLVYYFTDQHPLSGTSYYRIKVVGKDGHTNQSPIVMIINNQGEGVRIFPTLMQTNTFFVETDKTLRSARLEFFDLSGKKLSESYWESLDGRQQCALSGSGRLPSGTYLARLTANGQAVKSQLMIIQNN